jgi:hypothetical protein
VGVVDDACCGWGAGPDEIDGAAHVAVAETLSQRPDFAAVRSKRLNDGSFCVFGELTDKDPCAGRLLCVVRGLF